MECVWNTYVIRGGAEHLSQVTVFAYPSAAELKFLFYVFQLRPLENLTFFCRIFDITKNHKKAPSFTDVNEKGAPRTLQVTLRPRVDFFLQLFGKHRFSAFPKIHAFQPDASKSMFLGIAKKTGRVCANMPQKQLTREQSPNNPRRTSHEEKHVQIHCVLPVIMDLYNRQNIHCATRR